MKKIKDFLKKEYILIQFALQTIFRLFTIVYYGGQKKVRVRAKRQKYV